MKRKDNGSKPIGFSCDLSPELLDTLHMLAINQNKSISDFVIEVLEKFCCKKLPDTKRTFAKSSKTFPMEAWFYQSDEYAGATTADVENVPAKEQGLSFTRINGRSKESKVIKGFLTSEKS